MKLGIYKHFKGNLYKVIGIAQHSETLDEFVVYQALYGDKLLWIRPINMFLEKVVVNNQAIQRFKYIGLSQSVIAICRRQRSNLVEIATSFTPRDDRLGAKVLYLRKYE